MEKYFNIIALAVVQGLFVTGKLSNNRYNSCDLMNLSLESLDGIYRNLSSLQEKHKANSLIQRSKASEDIQKQLELVEAIFEVKKLQENEERRKRQEFKAKVEKLALLSKAKEAKQIEAINSLSLEEIDKQLEELDV